MSPRRISNLHRDVIASHHRMVALDTHSRFLATAAGFGGDKGGHLEKLYKRLAEGESADNPQRRTVSMAEIVAMGRQAAAEQANASDDERAEREAEAAAVADVFARHREAAARK